MRNKRLNQALLVVALAVLITCAVSARMLHPAQEASGAPDVATVPAGTHSVVCLGLVDLEHGVASLSLLQPGRVVEVPAHEGDEVAAGAVLLRVDDSLARLRVSEAEGALETARAELERASQLPAQHRVRLEQQKAAVEAAGERLAAARHGLSRKKQLQKVDQVHMEDVAAAENQVKELEAAERAEAAKLAELKMTDPEVDVRRAKLEVAAEQNRLDQARHALDECALKAPQDGTVLRVQVGPGDVLTGQPRQPAVLFAPRGPRLVRAEVDQEFAGGVGGGGAAAVEDDARSGATWHGRLVRIADWYQPRRGIVSDPPQNQDVRTVECIIELDPDQPLPRLGQRVRVTIGKKAS